MSINPNLRITRTARFLKRAFVFGMLFCPILYTGCKATTSSLASEPAINISVAGRISGAQAESMVKVLYALEVTSVATGAGTPDPGGSFGPTNLTCFYADHRCYSDVGRLDSEQAVAAGKLTTQESERLYSFIKENGKAGHIDGPAGSMDVYQLFQVRCVTNPFVAPTSCTFLRDDAALDDGSTPVTDARANDNGTARAAQLLAGCAYSGPMQKLKIGESIDLSFSDESTQKAFYIDVTEPGPLKVTGCGPLYSNLEILGPNTAPDGDVTNTFYTPNGLSYASYFVKGVYAACVSLSSDSSSRGGGIMTYSLTEDMERGCR